MNFIARFVDFFYENKEMTISEFRKSIIYYWILISTFMFFSYSVIFYFSEDSSFYLIKFAFGVLGLVLYVLFKQYTNYEVIALLSALIYSIYVIIAYLSPSEARVGFIWSYFVPVVFIFMLGYKKGMGLALIFMIIITFVGIIDLTNTNNQFGDIVSFSLFYTGLWGFLFFCLLVDFVFFKIQEKLSLISSTDALTKIYNRRKIDEVLQLQLDKDKFNNNLSVAILDIDNFKIINDTLGHLAGDEVLKIFANTLRNNLRNSDFVGRWGGEEFIIIFPDTSLDEAQICCQKLKEKTQKINYLNLNEIKCSIGIASSTKNITLTKIISQADEALYKAKTSGKDKIVLAK